DLDPARHEAGTHHVRAERTTLLHCSSELGRGVVIRVTPTRLQRKSGAKPTPPHRPAAEVGGGWGGCERFWRFWRLWRWRGLRSVARSSHLNVDRLGGRADGAVGVLHRD